MLFFINSLHFYRSQRSCGKVMFSQASVILFTGEGGVLGRVGACVAGVWQGECMVGACMAGETATAVDCTHPTGMHSSW